MKSFYYGTKEKNVINNRKLAEHYFIATGKRLKDEDIKNPEYMDKVASRFKGLYGRIENPSWRFLADRGFKTTAILVLSDVKDISLSDARRIVESFISNKKDKTNILTDANNDSNTETTQIEK